MHLKKDTIYQTLSSTGAHTCREMYAHAHTSHIQHTHTHTHLHTHIHNILALTTNLTQLDSFEKKASIEKLRRSDYSVDTSVRDCYD